ncbi:hypothetical protein MHB48_07945 [Psychrobacillus sp. FSL H8-0483]|uniref:hypothetical protein n=1 Tax=Psychrobacillus sp. FSL H8-0483 TaxID=2921389 RepID=UPI00315B040A
MEFRKNSSYYQERSKKKDDLNLVGKWGKTEGVEYVSERFELSFKNKEVKMGFYLAVPTFIIGSIIIFYGEQKYQYVRLLVLVIAWTIFYIWRFFHRRKQKKEFNNPS